MDNLIKELEGLKIAGTIMDEGLWSKCINLVENNFVPQKECGNERPCEEKDFREYRIIVDRNLNNIKFMLEHIIQSYNENNIRIDYDNILVKTFAMNLIYLIGEMHEKNIWNTIESVAISKELTACFCQLYCYLNVSQFLFENNNLSMILEKFRYKLQCNNWKTYPSAVAWYKWMLQQLKGLNSSEHIREILPTSLIIIDDYVPENVVIGLECLYQITNYSQPSLKKGFIDTGYAEAVYYTLERLAHQRNVKYVVPLYLCLTNILEMLDMYDNNKNMFEWTKRDEILSILLSHMEFERDVELRHAYMLSLPKLLNIGSTKWCEKIARILSDYCEHHTDLRTLKVTLKAGKAYLAMFNFRIAAHCISLYTAFLKLHFDLIKIPTFDMEIVQYLEDCIYYLYKYAPNIGCALIKDDRLRVMVKSKFQIQCLGDNKYLE
ncbi:TELO2-interacting protein 2-like [Polistes fuscatus]|uniref:TELO2-interacting protein 2-like n=1 Tax=Polistes fuscatus TaxID=30207 RepID=UPI001CA8491D|nr:TELO2-interacting protein 2-like [Polistes fuscatus]